MKRPKKSNMLPHLSRRKLRNLWRNKIPPRNSGANLRVSWRKTREPLKRFEWMISSLRVWKCPLRLESFRKLNRGKKKRKSSNV